MNSKPRVICIQPVGNPKFPRHVILDHAHNEFWTGKAWNADINKALLYGSDVTLLSNDCAQLQRQETVNKTHSLVITVPITIEVFSDQPIDPNFLAAWLQSCMRLDIDRMSGLGPTPDSVVLPCLQWDQLKKDEAVK